jgi:hypothetical protein
VDVVVLAAVVVAAAARHLQQRERRVDQPPFLFAHTVVVVGAMVLDSAVTVGAVDVVRLRPPPAEALERRSGHRPCALLGLLQLGRGERRGGAGDGDGEAREGGGLRRRRRRLH